MTSQREASIYRAYRATLRGIRGDRAGARKQRAREIVADRYKLPISALKELVRKHDGIAGVAHEPTAHLKERYMLEGALAHRQVEADILNPDRNCEHCKGTPTGLLTLPNGSTVPRGEARLRLDVKRYGETGEVVFLDTCYPCWYFELGGALAERHPIAWSGRTV